MSYLYTIGVSWNAYDHSPGDLATGNSNNGDALKHIIDKATYQIGSSRAKGGNAYAGQTRGAGISLGGEDAALLVAREDSVDDARTVYASWISIEALPWWICTRSNKTTKMDGLVLGCK
ncbi:hypothetical protein L6452_07839 [Arctium lappa]|uniref:Uncharacterized protein n=1 Tax=Arctium lappa TaxID=4217 RepID=A0ACB9EMJ4_ARCLA|nr:hypothetical protein L6452_07839 [Arctium lappa]